MSDVVTSETFSVYLLLTKVLIYCQSPYSSIDLTAAQVAKLGEMGGAAASNEIHRQIDQCTLIPINRKCHRA